MARELEKHAMKMEQALQNVSLPCIHDSILTRLCISQKLALLMQKKLEAKARRASEAFEQPPAPQKVITSPAVNQQRVASASDPRSSGRHQVEMFAKALFVEHAKQNKSGLFASWLNGWTWPTI
eukprot:764987-Hanusia_phi.AAC.1